MNEVILCCQINDLMYELKTLLSRNDPKQRIIDNVMREYQTFFRERYVANEVREFQEVVKKAGFTVRG